MLLKKVIRKLFRFAGRPWIDKKLFVQSLMLLYAMKFQLIRYDFKTLAQRYDLKVSESQPDLKASRELKKIGWAVKKASRFLPWRGSCLLQALTLQRLCVARQLHAEIFFGVTKREGKLHAHAWTKAGDTFLTGRDGHRAFTVVAVFSW